MNAPEGTDPDIFAPDAFVETIGDPEEHHGPVRMAYRMARDFAGKLLYVHGLGWHRWDGRRWTEDPGETYASRAVLDVLREALSQALGDDKLKADVKACERSGGVDGVLRIARVLVEFAVTTDDLDADPFLLNCSNGTLDLRTRELRPHDPADRLSKITVGAYVEGADTSVWDGFLEVSLPDADERAYLQRVIGQAVYGRVREHLFPVLIGTGANGKGTAYEAVNNALGDYSTIINPDLLMVRERGGVGGPEMMTLRGARLVIGSETEEGRKLDEAVMKRLTGGDTLTARNLYSPPVTWEPSHQLLYVTNHEPAVKGNDPAVWRRIRVVPFDVVIPPDKRDAGLPERLKLHADAILMWAVKGYFDYLDNGGMREPASVIRATDKYQAASDPVKRFVSDEEYVILGPDKRERAGQLYDAWSRWALRNRAEVISETAFAAELERLGYEKKKTAGGMVRIGLALV